MLTMQATSSEKKVVQIGATRKACVSGEKDESHAILIL